MRLAAEGGTPAGAVVTAGGDGRHPYEGRGALLNATVQYMRCLRALSLAWAGLGDGIEQDGVIVRMAMSRGGGIVEMFTAETVACFGWQVREGQYRLVYLTDCARGPGPTRREARAYSDYASTRCVPCRAARAPSDL